jgi:hypothetical protein
MIPGAGRPCQLGSDITSQKTTRAVKQKLPQEEWATIAQEH